jgi:formylglycine-generating enzyme required for sulfatase activity
MQFLGKTIIVGCGVALACAVSAQADVAMEWVFVGDPGNEGEWSGHSYGGDAGWGPDRICGAVDHTYYIGKYEVTNTQYAEFLNAVGAADPNDLYNTGMGGPWGGITRSGSEGGYTYSTIAGRGNKPVNFISWYDTLRFANWMHNGQPVGAQGPLTTEDGAYDMSLGSAVVRKPGALVFLPSEDEWYKAAYYKGGGTTAGYWDYATQTMDPNPPTAEAPPGTNAIAGSANYDDAVDDLTDVGAYTFKPSDSAYGTYDQAGNVWEWNEAEMVLLETQYRGIRGGSPDYTYVTLHAAHRRYDVPDNEYDIYGFRVAAIPEPTTAALLALGSAAVLGRRRRRGG